MPFPESALNEQAGKMIMENYDEYFKHAKMITSLYATPKELKALKKLAATFLGLDTEALKTATSAGEITEVRNDGEVGKQD